MKRHLLTVAGGLFTLLAALPLTAQAQDGYRIRQGDTLRIEVLEDPTLNRSSLVAPDGRIAVPLAGGIRASGRTIEDIQADLVARLTPSFAAAPTVFLSVERLAERRAAGPAAEAPTITVYVVGEAAKPGKLLVAPGTTVLQMFAEMGGFSRFAATKRIQLRRGDTTYPLNYDAIEAGISQNGSSTLADGDVIVVPQRKLFE